MTAEDVQALRDTTVYGGLFDYFDMLVEQHQNRASELSGRVGDLEDELEGVRKELTNVREYSERVASEIDYYLDDVTNDLAERRDDSGEFVLEHVEQDLGRARAEVNKLAKL